MSSPLSVFPHCPCISHSNLLQQFEEALKRSARQILTPLRAGALNGNDADIDNSAANPYGSQTDPTANTDKGPEIQVTLRSNARKMQFRELQVSPNTQREYKRAS